MSIPPHATSHTLPARHLKRDPSGGSQDSMPLAIAHAEGKEEPKQIVSVALPAVDAIRGAKPLASAPPVGTEHVGPHEAGGVTLGPSASSTRAARSVC